MSTVATLWVKLGLDSSGYSSGLKNSVSSTQSAGSKMGSALKTASKVAVASFAAVATAAVGVGTKSFLAAAAVDEFVIVNEVLAKNAGLSSEAVKKEAAEVKSMGIEAANSEQIVAEFVKANLDLASASDIARIAQDAAVVSQSNSSEAAKRITEGIVKMNPLILRNQGIIVDALTAYDRYASANGLVATELTKAQKQQAFLNEVMIQGEGIAGAYAAAMKEPGKVLRSFPRYFNEIFVSIGSVLKESFGKSVFAMADFVKRLGEAVKEGGALRPVIETIAEEAGKLADKFKEFLEGVDFEVIGSNLAKFVDKIKDLLSKIDFEKIRTDIGKFIENLTSWKTKALVVFVILSKAAISLMVTLKTLGITSIATGAQMVTAFAAPLAPILVVIGAFGLLLGAAVKYQKHIDETNKSQAQIIPQYKSMTQHLADLTDANRLQASSQEDLQKKITITTQSFEDWQKEGRTAITETVKGYDVLTEKVNTYYASVTNGGKSVDAVRARLGWAPLGKQFSKAELKQRAGFANGGISTGPQSGHLEMLHGTEAIIPLKSGSIPVDVGQGEGGSNAALLDEIRGLRDDFKSLPIAMRDLALMGV